VRLEDNNSFLNQGSIFLHSVIMANNPSPAPLRPSEGAVPPLAAVVLEVELGRDGEGLDCPICLQIMCQPRRTDCGHMFCRICLFQSTTLSPDGRCCPMCRANVTVVDEEGQLLPIDHELERRCIKASGRADYLARVEAAGDIFKAARKTTPPLTSTFPRISLPPRDAL
jgi:hypothetical protein